MQITIAIAKQKETQEIYEVFRQARSQMTYLPDIHTVEETIQFVHSLVAEGNVYVAKDGERIVGFTQLKHGWVEHLYIDPTFQNKGVGKLLLDKLKKLSPPGLCLWVFEDNTRAIAFYEREGFVLSEKRDQEHADNEEKLPDRKYVWRKK